MHIFRLGLIDFNEKFVEGRYRLGVLTGSKQGFKLYFVSHVLPLDILNAQLSHQS